MSVEEKPKNLIGFVMNGVGAYICLYNPLGIVLWWAGLMVIAW